EHLTTQALRQCLIEAIKSLPEREQLLLSLQFEHDLNQKEIAAVMEVSEGRISQLRSQAISPIRSYSQTHHSDRIPQEVVFETLLLGFNLESSLFVIAFYFCALVYSLSSQITYDRDQIQAIDTG